MRPQLLAVLLVLLMGAMGDDHEEATAEPEDGEEVAETEDGDGESSAAPVWTDPVVTDPVTDGEETATADDEETTDTTDDDDETAEDETAEGEGVSVAGPHADGDCKSQQAKDCMSQCQVKGPKCDISEWDITCDPYIHCLDKVGAGLLDSTAAKAVVGIFSMVVICGAIMCCAFFFLKKGGRNLAMNAEDEEADDENAQADDESPSSCCCCFNSNNYEAAKTDDYGEETPQADQPAGNEGVIDDGTMTPVQHPHQGSHINFNAGPDGVLLLPTEPQEGSRDWYRVYP